MTSPTLPAYTLAHAAGLDAGNRSARRHGGPWTRADYNAAARETNRILDSLGEP